MMKKISPVLLCSIAAVLVAAPVLAQSAADKARLDDIARKAAQEFASAKAAATDDQTRPATRSSARWIAISNWPSSA